MRREQNKNGTLIIIQPLCAQTLHLFTLPPESLGEPWGGRREEERVKRTFKLPIALA
jgi:hypothetical protein